jgi:hypothetical protein
MGSELPTRSCPFGVVREGAGKGAVTITKPDGGSRTIFFDGGRATGYDRSQDDAAELARGGVSGPELESRPASVRDDASP